MSLWHAGNCSGWWRRNSRVLGKIEYPLSNYCSHPGSTLAHRLSSSAMHGNQSRDWKPIAGGEYFSIHSAKPCSCTGPSVQTTYSISFGTRELRSEGHWWH